MYVIFTSFKHDTEERIVNLLSRLIQSETILVLLLQKAHVFIQTILITYIFIYLIIAYTRNGK